MLCGRLIIAERWVIHLGNQILKVPGMAMVFLLIIQTRPLLAGPLVPANFLTTQVPM